MYSAAFNSKLAKLGSMLTGSPMNSKSYMPYSAATEIIAFFDAEKLNMRPDCLSITWT